VEQPTPQVATDTAGNTFELRPVGCPTCEASELDFVGYRGGAHHRYGLGVVTRIVRCRTCGLLFPNPFPFPRDPQRLYGDPDKYFEAHDAEAKVAGYRRMIEELVRLSGVARPSLLDVGSGRGEALQAATQAGLSHVVGLDFSEAMRDEAAARYGVEIRLESIEEHAERAGANYDILLLLAVLEHVYDPDSMIAAAARLVRPGAVLLINVPQEPSLMTLVGNVPGRLRRSRTVYNLSPTFSPYHVFGFNPRALGALLAKHGFDPIRWVRKSSVRVPASGGVGDRVRASVATQVNRIGNLVGLSHDMWVWARRGQGGRAG
jgi:SAM-dependent methyltransferase